MAPMKKLPGITLSQAVLTRGEQILTIPASWQFNAGELWHVTGENGAGKTTLLMSILGLIPLYSGHIDVHSHSSGALYIGHRPGLNGALTVAENLRFLGGLYDQPFTTDITRFVLDQAGLAGYADVPCHQLSSGQKRRVQLARLWLPKSPDIWILDEPFTALDKAMIIRLEEKMQAHLDSRGLVLLTSHQDLHIAGQVFNLDDYRMDPDQEIYALAREYEQSGNLAESSRSPLS